jgi:hypothetical protein
MSSQCRETRCDNQGGEHYTGGQQPPCMALSELCLGITGEHASLDLDAERRRRPQDGTVVHGREV